MKAMHLHLILFLKNQEVHGSFKTIHTLPAYQGKSPGSFERGKIALQSWNEQSDTLAGKHGRHPEVDLFTLQFALAM